jgi:hypothetical protein
MCSSWIGIYVHLTRHPGLLSARAVPRYIRHALLRSLIGVIGYAVGGALGWFVQPAIALGIFLLLPAFSFVTSEGLPRVRRQAG